MTVTNIGSTLRFCLLRSLVKFRKWFVVVSIILAAACSDDSPCAGKSGTPQQVANAEVTETDTAVSTAMEAAPTTATAARSPMAMSMAADPPVTAPLTSGELDDDTGPCRATTYLECGILLDNSASMPGAASPRPSEADFDKLWRHIERCGGAVAVAPIVDRAQTAKTLYVEPPPTAPTARMREDADLITQTELQAVDDQARRRYATKLAAWRERAQAKIEQFKRAIDPILNPVTWSQRTAIQPALDVMDSFFLQQNSSVPLARRRQVLLIFSDARDDASPKPLRPMKSQPVTLLINQLDLGDLASFSVARVSDPQTAFRTALAGGR